WDRNVEIGAGAARHVTASARLAVLGLEPALHAEVRERVQSFACDEVDAAARAAVAAVGPAARNVLLAPETDRAVAASAGLDTDVGFVDELHDGMRNAAAETKKAPARGAFVVTSRRSSARHDADVQTLPRALRLECDPPVRERVQRGVAADSDVRAGAVTRAPLPHEDVAGEDLLPAETLHAEPFR